MAFEFYPDYAMKTNREGKRVREPWASGPSPLSMGLLTAGAGILAQEPSRWTGGNKNLRDFGKAGLLGLEAFAGGHQNLQNQRSDFYTQRRAEEDQWIKNQKYATEVKAQYTKEKEFPKIVEQLQAYNNPTISARLPTLIAMSKGDINTAYNVASNLLSAAAKTKWGEPELIHGSLFQKSGDEYKYLTTPTASGVTKLNAPEIMGQLVNSSTNMQEWNLTGRKGVMPAGLSPKNYDSLYRLKMNMDKREIKLRDKHGAETVQIIKERLDSVIDPTAYAILTGMPTARIHALSIDKPLIDTKSKKYTNEAKRSITEAKDIAKVGIIAQVENSLEKETFDPTSVSLVQYGQFFTSGFFPAVNEFSRKARSYENMALAGSRMFGYLFSGATVKDDENRAMRQVLYPMPGDSGKDVERKRQFRTTILGLYKTYIPPEISKKLFAKIISDHKSNKVTTNVEVEEIVRDTKGTLTAEEEQQLLDEIIPIP